MVFNLNVGILGHVDSGKTSLAKALSEVASTACFDKNPQSQERGITLDLGFSSFQVPTPEHLRNETEEEYVQYTLVDCPGHASLIRTIIGGAQIIDMMILVVDVTKGIQTQTAECIIIGELTCKKMIVVLNKIDLLSADKNTEKIIKKLRLALSTTIFKDSPFIRTAANPDNSQHVGIDNLIQIISEFSFLPCRNENAPFLMAVDHCFGIRGQGTVLTGTILQGSLQINDMVQIPAVRVTKKVKSMQMFRKPVSRAMQGDRLGICVTQFDPKLFERGIVCGVDVASVIHVALISVNKIKYFKLPVKTKSKFHISIGHETVMATITCFCSVHVSNQFDFDSEYQFCTELPDDNSQNNYFALLEFENPVLAVPKSLVIGSKLDMDVNTTNCRLAFWGTLLQFSDKSFKTTFLPRIKVFKPKSKIGIVDRVVNDNEIIVKSMFKKDTNLKQFVGLKVTLSTSEIGRIEGQFGQSGKMKVYIANGLDKNTVETLRKGKKSDVPSETVRVLLDFKRYVYDVSKPIIQ